MEISGNSLHKYWTLKRHSSGAQGRYAPHLTGKASWTFWAKNYTQSFVYDDLFNMTSQTATERKTPIEGGFKGITGSLNYEYDPLKPHQATKIGTAAYRRQSAEERCDNQYYYNYDANGNVVSESENPYIEEAAGRWEGAGAVNEGINYLDNQIPDNMSLSGGGMREDLYVSGLFLGVHTAEVQAAASVKTNSLLTRLGLRTPQKIGGGGRLQFIDPISKTYQGPAYAAARREMEIGSLRDTGIGFMQGFGEALTPAAEETLIPGKNPAQKFGQNVGRTVGSILGQIK